MHLEAISKKSFAQPTKGGQVSVLGPRFNSSEYLGIRVENPVTSRDGLNLGPALTLNQNPIFEMASIKKLHVPNKNTIFGTKVVPFLKPTGRQI
jgi:hypothetical protein